MTAADTISESINITDNSIRNRFYQRRILAIVAANTPNVLKRRYARLYIQKYREEHPEYVEKQREQCKQNASRNKEKRADYKKRHRTILNPRWYKEYQKNYRRDLEKKRAYDKKYREAHRESLKEYFVQYYLKYPLEARARVIRSKYGKYGITDILYDELYERQNGKCLICGAPQEVLCIDHDHNMGKIRGLLCNKCNRGLGCFGDDSNLIKRAADYLNGKL